MKKIALLLALAATPLSADEAIWSMIGRASQVTVEYHSFDNTICDCTFDGTYPCEPSSSSCFEGDTKVSSQVLLGPLPQEMGGKCASALVPGCKKLGYVLGDCQKDHLVGSFTQFGTTTTVHTYSCDDLAEAKCIRTAGTLTPDLLIESVGWAVGCVYP